MDRKKDGKNDIYTLAVNINLHSMEDHKAYTPAKVIFLRTVTETATEGFNKKFWLTWAERLNESGN